MNAIAHLRVGGGSNNDGPPIQGKAGERVGGGGGGRSNTSMGTKDTIIRTAIFQACDMRKRSRTMHHPDMSVRVCAYQQTLLGHLHQVQTRHGRPQPCLCVHWRKQMCKVYKAAISIVSE